MNATRPIRGTAADTSADTESHCWWAVERVPGLDGVRYIGHGPFMEHGDLIRCMTKLTRTRIRARHFDAAVMKLHLPVGADPIATARSTS